MSPGILGKKIGMTQVFRARRSGGAGDGAEGRPVRGDAAQDPGHGRLRCDPARFGRVRQAARLNKPTAGHLKKAGVENGAKFQREFRLRRATATSKPGDRILVEEFKPNDKVDVIGVSKGRGFAGFVKRHHFRGGDATHGSMFHRAPGSIGASSFPSRVFPGMRGAGHMGNEQVTVRNLEIVEVDTEDNVLLVKGAVPGPNGGYVLVRRAKR